MKFVDLLNKIRNMGFTLYARVNDNCVREIKGRFLSLSSKSFLCEVDDWRTGCLRNKEALGWTIKGNKYSCNLNDIYLVQELEVGGCDGGNVWGGKAEYYSCSNVMQSPFKSLETILLNVCPKLLYSEYLAIRDTMIEEIEYTEPGYYGNERDLVYRAVNLKKLHEYLIKFYGE